MALHYPVKMSFHMTHGSVVAREYGIPTIVGMKDATSRLKIEQLVRVDGEKGVITILEKEV